MSAAESDARATASKVAKWLLSKNRPDDAVGLLAAWAATGPNDSTGQDLLAEAFRIDPSAAVARMAFERMEGISGDHGHLDEAIVRFNLEELGKLETEMRKPSFRRAQVGFNNNIKYREKVFHVQTEDSGLDKPHIITHLFADGGRIIKSHKRSYAPDVERPDVAQIVRALMKGQHMEMVLMLREGKFDLVIDGKAMGGMETLTHPPAVDVKKMAKKAEGEGATEPGAAAPAATPPAPAAPSAPPPAPAPAAKKEAEAAAPSVTVPRPQKEAPAAPKPVAAKATEAQPVRFRLHVLRSLSGGPASYEPRGDEAIIGSSGAISLEGERFRHPREGAFRWRSGRLFVEDFAGGNGIFLRIRTPCELEFGDEFIVGDQLLRVLKNPIPQNGPDPGPTYFYSSPTWVSSFRIVQIFEGGALGACVVARGSTLVVGSTIGDLVLRGDPLVGEQHCMVEEQAGVIVLTDLGSRTGVFVRIRGEQELVDGDEVLVGRTRLIVEVVR